MEYNVYTPKDARLKNASGVVINPATEDKQDTMITNLNAIAGLVTDPFNYIVFTYVVAGNGAGEIETIVFKSGGSGGTTVATLTLTYNVNNNLESVTKT